MKKICSVQNVILLLFLCTTFYAVTNYDNITAKTTSTITNASTTVITTNNNNNNNTCAQGMGIMIVL